MTPFKPKTSWRQLKNTAKPAPDRPPVAKTRTCLMHMGEFHSTHSGERICDRCKDLARYRDRYISFA